MWYAEINRAELAKARSIKRLLKKVKKLPEGKYTLRQCDEEGFTIGTLVLDSSVEKI